uniref:Uncharacterized protein n=1 Tax=Noccaea caerulescens TaxID=107243 RepID=A0A1J3E5F8_NOCCA
MEEELLNSNISLGRFSRATAKSPPRINIKTKAKNILHMYFRLCSPSPSGFKSLLNFESLELVDDAIDHGDSKFRLRPSRESVVLTGNITKDLQKRSIYGRGIVCHWTEYDSNLVIKTASDRGRGRSRSSVDDVW